MFLRCNEQFKNGKSHRYWNIVENKLTSGNRIVQRQVLYLGEINDNQQDSWRKTIEIFEDGHKQPKQMFLFPEDASSFKRTFNVIHERLNELQIKKSHQWGACWLFCERWNLLEPVSNFNKVSYAVVTK